MEPVSVCALGAWPPGWHCHTRYQSLLIQSLPPPLQFECEDVEGDGNLFDALGVGLGRPEMQAAMLAVKKLGEDGKRGVATVRFFGKFFGTQADYYVFETTLKDNPEMPEAPGGVVRGGVSRGASAPAAARRLPTAMVWPCEWGWD